MSGDDITAFLAQSDLFGALDAPVRTALAERLVPVAVRGGEVVMREGEAGDGLYLVAAGRLQAQVLRAGEPVVVGEIGRGEVVGELALLTDHPRNATVVALRDSDLLHLPIEAFQEVVQAHPVVLRPVSAQVVERLRRTMAGATPARPVSTLSIVTLHDSEEAERVIDDLVAALGRLVGTVAEVRDEDRPADGRDAAWAQSLESDHDLVVFRSGARHDEWTERCLRLADAVVLVADARRAPAATPVEGHLDRLRAQVPLPVELVLVHPPATDLPSGTHRWLAGRDVRRHHHARVGETAHADRIARLLTNRGVGLVLSGGGARGMAEIGVLRAMEELGMPVDAVGGTSAGSLVAGAAARGWASDQLGRVLRRALVDERNPVDLTLPVTSIASGRRMAERLQTAAGEADIEDTWLDFFCVSTNLSRLVPKVHRRGRGWRAIRASMSIPGVFPPVAEDGDVLVDGGLVDNLPVTEMRRGHDGVRVVAVDVGVHRGLAAGDLPDSTVLPGWRLLVDRLDPRRTSPDVVNIVSLLTRLTELGGGQEGESDDGDILVRPDVGRFGLLDFSRFDELVEVGYREGLAVLSDWPATP